MTAKDAVKLVLGASNEPLDIQQITERILDQGLWKTEGKTPDQTVAAAVYMDIKKYGNSSCFKKASKGKFALNTDRFDEPDEKVELKPVQRRVVETQVYSFTDSALKVLEEFGSRKPMHYKDITREALNAGWLITEGKTPESTMYAQILTEIKQIGRASCRERV